ncbi:hypothetical protein LV779_03825 [Streptomyces thinghirensis]|nr:hypothetical protein [Streptomyces thinghirensis]
MLQTAYGTLLSDVGLTGGAAPVAAAFLGAFDIAVVTALCLLIVWSWGKALGGAGSARAGSTGRRLPRPRLLGGRRTGRRRRGAGRHGKRPGRPGHQPRPVDGRPRTGLPQPDQRDPVRGSGGRLVARPAGGPPPGPPFRC